MLCMIFTVWTWVQKFFFKLPLEKQLFIVLRLFSMASQRHREYLRSCEQNLFF